MENLWKSLNVRSMGTTSSVAQKGPDEMFSDEESRQGAKTDAVDSAQPEVAERTRIDLLEKDIECDSTLIYTQLSVLGK